MFCSDHHKELIKSFQMIYGTQFPSQMSLTPTTSSESNYGRKLHLTRSELAGSQTQNAASIEKPPQHSVVFGLVALLTVPLNPVRCVFMPDVTRRSGE